MRISAGKDPITAKPGITPRSRAPVFVVGCSRSGTTLLYHMLLSAGDFAVYRAESQVFNLLMPRFGNLRIQKNRERLMHMWLKTRLFAVTGLDSGHITAKILRECKNYGDFLRIVMEEIAVNQNVHRWADCTPEHLLYMRQIKETVADALIIHIIRDGRDVALSLGKQGFVRPFRWDKKRRLTAAALYWRWIVNKGREYGQFVAPSYMEVRYEELVNQPRRTLASIGDFIDHDLDYDRILRAGIGSVSQPNTSFELGHQKGEFNPVGRWKKLLTSRELGALEDMIGDLLLDLGYQLQAPLAPTLSNRVGVRMSRLLYDFRFDLKEWVKTSTRLNEIWRREVPILAPYSAVS